MSANFSDLQSVDTANGADQMMLRLNNGATGPDGFARIEISDLNSVFTSNLTASDAKVKQMSAQWDNAYSQVNANSGVFTLTNSNSAQWDAAYTAVTGQGFNFGIKEFDYVTINGPFDSTRINLPVFIVKRNPTTTADMVQVQPVNTTSMFRITTAGSVGININQNYNFAAGEVLYVNGNQRIDGTGGNALTVNGDLFVNGSLSALSATIINSVVTNTSALSVTNNGIGPALFVRQTGAQPVTVLRSDIATTTFAYNGDITGFSNLSGSGRIIAGASNTALNATSYILGTSNNDSNLANVNIFGSNITAPAANYTYVQNLSTAGNIAANAVTSNTVAANSVAAGGKTSSDWNSTYATVNTQSAALLPLFSTVSTQSANNASVYSSFNTQSASNASVYSTTRTNSATWSRLSTAFNVVTAINTNALSAIGIDANIDAALIAKGTGATLAQFPDNAIAGGNARGAYATDLQKYRSDASQVASGQYSTIVGGTQNIASGESAAVGGGTANNASGVTSTIAGGFANSAVYLAAVGGGYSNDASANSATIAGGYDNTASGNYSTVGGGSNNASSGIYSTVVGGKYNVASGVFSTSIGVAAYATNYGELAVSSGSFSSYGDNKSSTLLFRRTTNAAGSAVAYLDGLTNTEEITLPPNSTYAYTATIVGLSSHSNSSGLHYILRGFAKCNGSSVVTVYPTTSDLTQRIPATLNASMSATGDKLRIVVYSPTTVTHYWTARVQAEFLQF